MPVLATSKFGLSLVPSITKKLVTMMQGPTVTFQLSVLLLSHTSPATLRNTKFTWVATPGTL